MVWLDQPVSLTNPSAPGDFSFISSAFILLPGKMKDEGIAAPLALMHPKTVKSHSSARCYSRRTV